MLLHVFCLEAKASAEAAGEERIGTARAPRTRGLRIKASSPIAGYDSIVSELIDLVESARRVSARAVNSIVTATYWEIGRRIVESEQKGRRRAGYGEALLKNLAFDLTAKFGRGFGLANLKNIRKFYLTWPIEGSIGQTASDQSASQRIDPSSDEKGQTLSGLSKGGQGLARLRELAGRFPLPWSHYVRLLALSNGEARKFYETEALRCGWSVRQLDRQISSQFYERTALSRNKVSMLKKAGKIEDGDLVTPEEEIKDPFILEFLGLKDEYSESELEEVNGRATTLISSPDARGSGFARKPASFAVSNPASQ